MKKILSIALLASLGFSINLNNIKDLKGTFLYNQIQENPNISKVDIIKHKSYEEILINTKNNQIGVIYYLPKDKKFFIGKIINANGTLVTPDIKLSPQKLKALNNAVMFKCGTGKKKIFIFTDPDCPYCEAFFSKLGNEFLKKYQANIILLPLSFHKYANKKSAYILSAKTNAEKCERFFNVIKGKDNNFLKEDNTITPKIQKILQKGKNIAINLKIQGVPTVLNANGIEISRRNIIINSK